MLVLLPGSCKVQADLPLRVGQTLQWKWSINPEHLHPEFASCGAPRMKLLASYGNRKLPVVALPIPGSHRPVMDLGMVYAFHHLKMMSSVLIKILHPKRLQVILAAPDYTCPQCHGSGADRDVTATSTGSGRSAIHGARSQTG